MIPTEEDVPTGETADSCGKRRCSGAGASRKPDFLGHLLLRVEAIKLSIIQAIPGQAGASVACGAICHAAVGLPAEPAPSRALTQRRT